jgi:hypothetical protein
MIKLASALVVCALIGVGGAAAARAADSPARGEFHHSYPLSSNGSFTIDDDRGSIRIIAWDKSSVQIDATQCAPTQAALAHLTISVDAKRDGLDVHTLFPPPYTGLDSFWHYLGWHTTSCDQNAQVDYVIRLPAKARLAITTASADVDVAGVSGTMRVDTASGDITASDGRDATISTSSGDISVNQAHGTFATTSTSGDVLFNDVSGDITVDSTSGDVGLYRVSGKVVVVTTSGNITARSFSGIARLNSTSGDVSMTLVRGNGVALSASTSSGDIESDVPQRSGAPVSVRTQSGDISVRSL